MSELVIVKRPVVAGVAQKTSTAAIVTGFAAAGLGVFFWLSSARAAMTDRQDSLPALAASTSADTQAAAPPAVAATVAASTAGPFSIPNSGPVTLVASTPAPVYGSGPIAVARNGYSTPTAPPTDPLRDRAGAPALVIDFAQAEMPRMPGSGQIVRSDSDGYAVVTSAPSLPPIGVPVSGPASANDRNLSETERFSARVGGEEAEVVQARRMTGLDRLVPQGAVIGAVMETALNSDQPGFARAMTQRDVYSFDGSAILIPAGSRIIGQYKSGVAQGASRLFVLWTRLIRPDGVSIELGSPATDDLGRGGIGGKVNRHFVQRFGGAILTSVLSGGISAATSALSRGSTIFVGSASQASSLASQATQSSDIPPTITTRQGTTVRIFVARDLDFSRVGPAR